MAFSVGNRVKVTDQSSQWRGKLGTVESVDSGNNQVRLDGHPVGKTVLLLDAELMTTNISSPVTYS